MQMQPHEFLIKLGQVLAVLASRINDSHLALSINPVVNQSGCLLEGHPVLY
jgi:hypothetical protein